ncbi:pneumococcal serine-rich repeat protein isoform X2 [Eurosta solidaginis]|uniref:pneumococcal serine-rich repeat protein isoform X2 n=1 Tax=Eurosta solidaginis TaxID=178769 RepID=UPI00353162C3
MEVATTSNHHHHNHHHHHHHLGHQLHHPTATKHRLPMAKQEQQQTQNKLSLTVNNTPAVDASASNTSPRSPFQREVREWQRVDPDTGALLSGRLEADRWINGPLNKYGKISDSQNISQSNGTQHTQRKQLEVLQRRTANGAVQVIRAQTVQTSSSRSWSSSNSNSASTSASASASASPICVANSAAGVGGTSSSGGGGRSIVHNHNNNHTHFHSTLEQHLAEANTHWLQLSPPTIAAANVDISEVSTDDDHDKAAAAELVTALATEPTPYIVDDVDDTDDDHNERHDDVSMNCDYSISRNSSGVDGEGGVGGGMDGGGGGKGQIMNGDSEFTVATVNSQCSARLVPDTAPSLKLSNLMKSNSGGSNNTDSSGNNSTTTTNTHTYIQSAATGKVSLHSIVGGGGGGGGGDETTKCAPTTAITNGTTVPGTKTWQQQKQQERQQHNAQHLEQATLYGQNINSSRARVGVLADCCDVGDHNDDGVSCVAPKTKLADADETQSHYKHNHNNEQTKNDLSGALTPTRRRDLESFRQYASSKAKAALEADIAEREMQTLTDDKHASKHDDDLRLSTRQLRRQQQPFSLSSSSSSASTLQRSHSISTDDLSNDWENEEGVAESNEWRRVSKLRRSFQSSSSANNNNSNEQLTEPSLTATRRRPFDLPASSVSVSRIRAELESGRRLTTAMRNNRVDLAALDSILHGPKEEVEKTRGNSQKTNALLTAESLKEIRGRLKKLSDESLYKDDFIAHQQPPSADEHIEVQQSVRRKLTSPRLQQLTPDQSLEITQKQQTNYAAERAQRNFPERDPLTTRVGAVASTRHSPSPKQHTSRSLETRQKVKDTNSLEWHSRRKSYGFEKVSPPDAKSMSRMDASTDSGLGRSSELNNWSPTEPTPTTRATVIHFGEPTKTAMNSQTPYRTRIKSPARHTPTEDEDLHKRYSIAVDESQYVRDNLRKTSQVHLNGFQEPNLQLSRFESTADGIQSLSASNSSSTLFQRSQNAQKRVEFCKTEVHFAAESGRVNIVETDGKPPPTNNFRRRRRTTSGALQILTRTAASAAVASLSAEAAASTAAISNNVTLFGDSDDLYQQRHRTIASSLVAYRATLVDPQDNNSGSNASALSTSVTVSVQKTSDSHGEVKRGSYASTTSGIDTTDNENDEISAIRGILKNKPVKPKPYHLGENIESADALWGVQLKPVAGGNGSTALSNREKDDSPTAALNKSVAERVRIVEKRREHTGQNGYSTKINLSLDEPTPAIRDWPNAGIPKLMPVTDHQEPSPTDTQRRASAQELILQDLREHQRMLDEGLKSTSLIIKTLRSANEFDEAMRRLSIASLESATIIPPIIVPTPMLCSNSYQETVRRLSNVSLENTEREVSTQTIVSTTITNVNGNATTTTTSRRLSYENQSAFVTPISLPPMPLVAPRLKLLGNSDSTVSQQLSKLRRMYDIAENEQRNAYDDDIADSADEEVKSYFCTQENEQSDSGGGTLESSSQDDERAGEYTSGSWSRLKAKRTVWKVDGEEQKAEQIKLYKSDLPKSNVMSIELHSPQISLEKRDSFKRNSHTAPVARPRTISSALNSTEQQQPLHSGERYNNSTAEQREALKIVKEARGARKLRDHELSYFGVPNSQNQDEIYESKANRLPNVTSTNTISANKRTLPNHQHHQRSTIIGNENTTNLKMLTRRHDDNATNTEEATNTNETTTATKWQLLNDKPDLLRHSPMAVEPQLIRRTAEVQPVRKRSKSAERGKHLSPLRLTNERHNFNDDGADQSDHFYENIANEKITPVFKVKSPQPYDRKTDVERDAYLLSEMNENADITMKALSDEVAHKDRRRRRRSSLHRRESTPLETIDEKMVTRKPSDKCIAVKMSRGTLASEAKRHTRPATSSPQMYDTPTRVRTSSQSSVESSPRARSRSLSSEREYGNIRSPKSTRATSTSATKTQHTRIGSSSAGGASCGKQQHRSSSRDSQRSARLQYSSGDEVSANEQQRVRLKSKRSTNPTTASASSRSVERRSKKESISERAHQHETQKHHTTASRDEDRRHAASSTTHASQREERAECTARSQQQQRATSSGQSSKCREEPSGNTGSGSSGRHAISRANTAKSRSGIGSGIRLFRSLRGRADDTHTCAVHHSAEARMSSEHRSTSGRDKIGGGEHEHGKVEGVRERESLREREHEREIERAHEKENGRESKSQARELLVLGILIMGATQPQTLQNIRHSKSTQNMNGRHTGGHHDGRRHKHNEQSHATKEHRKRSTRSGK